MLFLETFIHLYKCKNYRVKTEGVATCRLLTNSQGGQRTADGARKRIDDNIHDIKSNGYSVKWTQKSYTYERQHCPGPT